LLLAASVAGVQLTSVGIDDGKMDMKSYTKAIETGRKQRVDRLKAPDGWLSLVGLFWLKEGKNVVGTDKKSDIVLDKGPAHLGDVTLAKGKVSIKLDMHAPATIGHQPLASGVLQDDASGEPTVVSFGTESLYVIDRNGRKGLRVKDTEAKARAGFKGIEYYPIDPKWRVEAKYTPFNPPHTLEIPNVIGQVDKMPVPGKVEFERDGKKYTLLPVLEEPDAKELWFIFADKTSAKETYGGGRFLYSEMPRDGKVIVDFNKAYNPPCAFTPYATCPLAPPENRLGLPVTAGEKKYRGGHH
jgi:uncharacterized protein (DUF1684 family)